MQKAYTGAIPPRKPGDYCGTYNSAPDLRGRSPYPRPRNPRAFRGVSKLSRSAPSDGLNEQGFPASDNISGNDSSSSLRTVGHIAKASTTNQDRDHDVPLSLFPMDSVNNILHLFRPPGGSGGVKSRESSLQLASRYQAQYPLGSATPRVPVSSLRYPPVVRSEVSENDLESSTSLLPVHSLTSTLENELLCDHPKLRSFFRTVQDELEEEKYREFLVAVLQWWRGRLHTSRMLDQFRSQTAHFVKLASKLFSSKAWLLEALTSLLRLRGRSKLYLCFSDTKDILFVVLEIIKDSQILAVSSEVNDAACNIRSTVDLRAVLASPDALSRLLDLNPIWVPCVMQLLQLELDNAATDEYRKMCLKYLRQLAKVFRALPPSLTINHIQRTGSHAIRGGGFADIWKGQCGGQTVCLKVLRMFIESDERTRDKLMFDFCHEALIWRQLHHPNVLPFLGVNMDAFTPGFCLVSPWMSNGDVLSYLRNHPEHDKRVAITEIASGLNYLHSLHPAIIHGDIRAANILITDEGRCCLADFGLTLVAESQVLASTNGNLRGSVRWLAPELLCPSDNLQSSKIDMRPRDVYAFAHTMFEILSGRIPFSHCSMDGQVVLAVISGKRPPRPQGVWCPDDMWKLVEMCWAQDATHRPDSESIRMVLENQTLSPDLHSPSQPPSNLTRSPWPPYRTVTPSIAEPIQNVMWVENIPQHTPLDELKTFFNKSVPGLKPLSISLRDRGCAFVKYSTEVELVKAISTFNGQALRPHIPSGPLLRCQVLVRDDAKRHGYLSASEIPRTRTLRRIRKCNTHQYPRSRDGYTSSPAPTQLYPKDPFI